MSSEIKAEDCSNRQCWNKATFAIAVTFSSSIDAHLCLYSNGRKCSEGIYTHNIFHYICTKLPRGLLRAQLKSVNVLKEIINAFLRPCRTFN